MVNEAISDACLDVEALAKAVDRGQRGEIDLDEALAEYEQGRVEAASAGFTTTVQAGASAREPGGDRSLLRPPVRADAEREDTGNWRLMTSM